MTDESNMNMGKEAAIQKYDFLFPKIELNRRLFPQHNPKGLSFRTKGGIGKKNRTQFYT
jgi:hypothetical protein